VDAIALVIRVAATCIYMGEKSHVRYENFRYHLEFLFSLKFSKRV
jgi:hypothetical protein